MYRTKPPLNILYGGAAGFFLNIFSQQITKEIYHNALIQDGNSLWQFIKRALDPSNINEMILQCGIIIKKNMFLF